MPDGPGLVLLRKSFTACGETPSTCMQQSDGQTSEESTVHFVDGDVGSIWLTSRVAPIERCSRQGHLCPSPSPDCEGHESLVSSFWQQQHGDSVCSAPRTLIVQQQNEDPRRVVPMSNMVKMR